MTQICQISNFKLKSPESYDDFQKVVKHIEGFCECVTMKTFGRPQLYLLVIVLEV
jgi:hypothetical protein